MEAPATADAQMGLGEPHEHFIRVTNHGKMRSWIAFSLNFLSTVSLILHGVLGVTHPCRFPIERNI